MNVVDELMHEHRKAESLLAALAASERGDSRHATICELEEILTTHMAFEERFLYPLVSQVLDPETAEEARAEHTLLRAAFVTLQQFAAQPGFDAAVEMLKAGIDHHIESEESKIFPHLRRHASGILTDAERNRLQQPGSDSGV